MTSLPVSQDRREWTKRAPELGRATMAGLTNRIDACGGYRHQGVTTKKNTDRDWVEMRTALPRHFASLQVLGLHSTSRDNQCRWVAFDIDAHGPGDVADDNHQVAMAITERLHTRGMVPYVFDSDGRGGYHIWAMLLKLTASEDAYALVKDVADGFDVETFPKQARIREGGYGNWLRLPGKHPRRYHWSRLWTGQGWADARETVAAVIALGMSAHELLP